MNKKIIIWLVIVLVILLGAVFIFNQDSNKNTAKPISATSKVVQIVAAENFWGSLISQLGGTKVNVVSIVSDPNADPHEYESNTNNAREVANADYVIENGAGYDFWMDKLLSPGGNPNRKVLNAADLLGKKNGDNPHFWYYPDYVNQVIAQMEKDLVAIDPANTQYYTSQYIILQKALKSYQDRVASIKQQFGGTKIASTESIFVYPAQALGLDLISPTEFMNAIDEGNDPTAQSVIQFENLLKNDQVKVLVYNEQTVTPITLTMKKIAGDANIPVVGITETIQPPDTSFQDWMNAELINLENALNAGALGK
jgi:zinc/manganese transport system substrate-binding protein